MDNVFGRKQTASCSCQSHPHWGSVLPLVFSGCDSAVVDLIRTIVGVLRSNIEVSINLKIKTDPIPNDDIPTHLNTDR